MGYGFPLQRECFKTGFGLHKVRFLDLVRGSKVGLLARFRECESRACFQHCGIKVVVFLRERFLISHDLNPTNWEKKTQNPIFRVRFVTTVSVCVSREVAGF